MQINTSGLSKSSNIIQRPKEMSQERQNETIKKQKSKQVQ